ncbi:MAG: WecB/TagA/CpsF family glycosyltransferase [Treponema sp.]|nr:WecB/TagA/CpsF family glycosyltransferase [Treponema sp.]
MNRIELLGVPVDILRPEELQGEIMRILEKPGHKQIVFLTVWDLLRARNTKKDFGAALREADLVLPVSKSILRGAKFLKLDVPVRYNPFNAVIQILNTLDQHYKTLYLLGGHKKTVQTAERHVRDTFHQLRIVGRYVGYFPKSSEGDVIQAIYKASPSLVIVGDGIKEKNLWSYHRRDKFSSSIFLYYRDCLGIFAGRIRRVSEKTFDAGNEIRNEIAHNPLKIFLIFPYMRYKLLLLFYRLFRKNGKPKQKKNKTEEGIYHVESVENKVKTED